MAILLAFLSSLAGIMGGYLAMAQRGKLKLTLGFTAGVLLGLVAFDILPEIFEIAYQESIDIHWPMIALVLGFLLFHTVEKLILIHHSHEERYVVHRHPQVGTASAAALVGHSFLDGMSIGLAFQLSNSVGTAVAIAVIGHRFADGFNTINLMLYHGNSRRKALRLLGLVALAPLLGAVSTFFYSLPQAAMAIYLGFFAGFMLYISASDILPQAHSKGSSRAVIILTILGAASMFIVAQVGHGHFLDG